MLHIEGQNRYRIIRKIGEGGMGSIYEAIQEGVNGFQKSVALKMIRRDLLDDPHFIELFIKEAKLVACLNHEGVVQIHNLGQSQDGLYYMVMDYVRGMSLAEFINHHVNVLRKEIPQELAIFICSKIGRALGFAHQKKNSFGKSLNIIHQDVSPSNILLSTEGQPKIADFGIASLSMEEDMLTSSFTKYSSPEQVKGGHIDLRSDIYSLGLVLLHMLKPEIDNPKSLLSDDSSNFELEVCQGDYRDELIEIFKNSLALSSADRYNDCNDFATALEFTIYRKGYGPTIKTLENYLKLNFPYLYNMNDGVINHSGSMTKRSEVSATVILEQNEDD